MNPRVKYVKPYEDYSLIVTFTNNEVKLFDVKPYLSIGDFHKLKEKAMFYTVKPFSGSIQWQNGLDLCPDMLYADGQPFHNC